MVTELLVISEDYLVDSVNCLSQLSCRVIGVPTFSSAIKALPTIIPTALVGIIVVGTVSDVDNFETILKYIDYAGVSMSVCIVCEKTDARLISIIHKFKSCTGYAVADFDVYTENLIKKAAFSVIGNKHNFYVSSKEQDTSGAGYVRPLSISLEELQ